MTKAPPRATSKGVLSEMFKQRWQTIDLFYFSPERAWKCDQRDNMVYGVLNVHKRSVQSETQLVVHSSRVSAYLGHWLPLGWVRKDFHPLDISTELSTAKNTRTIKHTNPLNSIYGIPISTCELECGLLCQPDHTAMQRSCAPCVTLW